MRCCTAVLVSCLTMFSTALSADPASDAAKPDDAQARLDYMLKSAGKYLVTDGDERQLELHADPLLRFNNTVSGVPDGVLVMWKDGARPAAFAQVFQIKDGLWIHEAQSVARSPLRFELDGESKWTPREAAPEFKMLDGAPTPAGSPGARRLQTRQLVERFTGTDDFKISPSDAESERSELRRLPTPVYRYSAPDAGVIEGAVFAYVHGTDPELLLILEARREGDVSGWYYALAAMTCWGVQARLDGEEVWTSPERFGSSTAGDLYHVWVFDE